MTGVFPPAPAPPDEPLWDQEFLYRDWSVVHELTDVSMFSWDLELGARWRLPAGYGIELAWTRTSYHDKDPILEDETGRYNALSMMVSRSF